MSYLLLILSVLVGSLLVFFIKPGTKFTKLILSFSGAYLLSITIFHLLPEVYINSPNTKKIGILIITGILIQSILESFSKGIEHGHIHLNLANGKFPWLLFISLCLHSFSEGIPIHYEYQLLWAIVIHKIPVAIVLTSFFIESKYSKKNIFVFLLLFSLMSPLGIFMSDKIDLFLNYQTEITAVIIGIFLHISTIILFESSKDHSFNIQKFIAILFGVLLTIVTLH